jgi:hypothetical protein
MDANQALFFCSAVPVCFCAILERSAGKSVDPSAAGKVQLDWSPPKFRRPKMTALAALDSPLCVALRLWTLG